MSEQLHTCSYTCPRPECIKAQRAELLGKVERQAAEIERLRTGDTCARMCEGTAYRIEARNLSAQVERLRALLRECEPWVDFVSGDLGRRIAAALAAGK